MIEIELVPGIANSPAPITIPVGMPSIDDVVSAQIWRLPRALGLDNHTQAQIVAALDPHAVHSHPLAFAAGGGGGTLIAGAALLSLSAGAQVVGAGGVAGDGVRNNAAAQAHTAGGATVPHAGAAALIEAAVPTKITETTFSLDVNTALGDILTLIYLERGARLRPN